MLNYYNQNKTMVAVFLGVLMGCGGGNQENIVLPQQSVDPMATPEQTDTNLPLEEDETARFELQPPQQYGGPWKRKLVFHDSPPKDTIVEKLNPDGEWVLLGLTNEKGEVEDTNIAFPTQYKLGRKIESKKFEAVFDAVLSGTMEKNAEVAAYRVVVSDNLFLGRHSLSIRAKIFRVDGGVFAFPSNQVGTDKAGVLSVQANIVEGKGVISLQGLRGKSARPGVEGAVGYNQSCARLNRRELVGRAGTNATQPESGGEGGEVIIFANKVDLKNISARGGIGGTGARGGPGGRGGRLMQCRNKTLGEICGISDPQTRAMFLNSRCSLSSRRAATGSPGRSFSDAKSGTDGKVLIFNTPTIPGSTGG